MMPDPARASPTAVMVCFVVARSGRRRTIPGSRTGGSPMALKVIGAGLGRTGTHSLQLALQQLLGGPCYHMLEVMADPDVRVQQWMDAMDGHADWDRIMDGYVASVDWPASAFWRELADK